jgi:hypothetical protein
LPDGIPYPSEWQFEVGEAVCDRGSNPGTIVEVLAIPPGMRRAAMVRLENDTLVVGPIPLSSRTLRKRFNVGDYVKCTTSSLEGWIVSIPDEGALIEVVHVVNTNPRGIEYHVVEWEGKAKVRAMFFSLVCREY